MTISFKEIILRLGFILLLSAIVCASPNPKICRKREGKFPRPGTSCRGYYDCKNYVPVEKSCGDGEHFNAIKGWCDWEDLYPCLEKKKDKECLKENGLFLKPGTDCKKYYRCCNGKAKVEACSGDSLFDPSKGKCEWPDIYTCVEKQKDKECLRENGLFLKPRTDCKKYYRCSNGKAKVEACSGDLLFDPSKEKCEWPDIYTCIESLSTTEKISSTVTIFATSTSPETSSDPAISKSTIQKTTASNRIVYSTNDPDSELTNSRIFETSTKMNTAPTSTDGKSTFQTSDTSTISQATIIEISTSEPKEISTSKVSTPQSKTSEISTLQPTIEVSTLQPITIEISTSQPTTEVSTTQPTTEVSTSQSTTEISTTQPITEVSTTQPTTEVSTTQPTTEVSTTQPTTEVSTTQPTTEISTTQPTTETSIISQTTSAQMSSHSTDHTILKENKENELTMPTIFETTMEVTFSPSTVEVTTSGEVNIMCPEPNGYFPHPTDKHKFVGCVGNIPYVLSCPSDLVYIHHLRRCDHE